MERVWNPEPPWGKGPLRVENLLTDYAGTPMGNALTPMGTAGTPLGKSDY